MWKGEGFQFGWADAKMFSFSSVAINRGTAEKGRGSYFILFTGCLRKGPSYSRVVRGFFTKEGELFEVIHGWSRAGVGQKTRGRAAEVHEVPVNRVFCGPPGFYDVHFCAKKLFAPVG